MQGSEKRKRSAGIKVVVMGLLSISLYVLLLAEQDAINDYFGRGGLFAFLPILTAFIFSLVHGSFTGNFWSFFGMHPKQKQEGH